MHINLTIISFLETKQGSPVDGKLFKMLEEEQA